MNPLQNKTTTVGKALELNDLFIDKADKDNASLVRHLGTMRSKASELAVIYDEKQRKAATKWNEDKKRKMLRKLKLLKAIFSNAKSVSDVQNNIDTTNAKVKHCKESNLNTVFHHTKPYEKTARALDLLHFNKGRAGKLILFPVDKQRFAEPGNNFMLNRDMKNLLDKEFYKFKMSQSPLYITYLDPIEDTSIIRKIAEIAHDTMALAVLDVPSHIDIQEFKEFADEMDITGVESLLGHLVLPSSHINISGVKDFEIKQKDGTYYRLSEKDMEIPSSGSFVGALLAAEPGEVITGMNRRGIKGATGVVMKYNLERIDATEIAQKGFVMLAYTNNQVRILGTSTGNTSDREELHQFPKVDVRNTIGKALIQFSNEETFGAWGAKESRRFVDKVRDYLNDKVSKGIIAGYKLDGKNVRYNKATKRVEINIAIAYTNIVDGFVFSLEGIPGEIELKN